jgi:hypothetical protein
MALEEWFVTNRQTELFPHVAQYLEKKTGFLPKPNYMSLETGVEFLKTIFIMQDSKVVALPILGSFSKIGKTLKKPTELFTWANSVSYSQLCLDTTFAQLNSRGNLLGIAGLDFLYGRLMRRCTNPGEAILKNFAVKFAGTTRVKYETVERAYLHRYGVSWQEFSTFCEDFSNVPTYMYPFHYTSTVVERAAKVDYEIPI